MDIYISTFDLTQDTILKPGVGIGIDGDYWEGRKVRDWKRNLGGE